MVAHVVVCLEVLSSGDKSVATRFRFDSEDWWFENLCICICVVKPDLGQGI